MDKEQALHTFWSQFGIKAYDMNTVPTDEEFKKMGVAPFPRITYEVLTDNFGAQNALTASIWDKSPSWGTVTTLLHTIEQTLGMGGQTVRYDGGMLWVKRGQPFSRRGQDPDDSIRRIVLTVEVEYISEV